MPASRMTVTMLAIVSVFSLSACGRAGVRTVAPVAAPRTVEVAPTDVPVGRMPAVERPPRDVSSPRVIPAPASEPVDEPEQPVVEEPAPPVTWDIEVAPYESHARVEYFVKRFSGSAKEAFELALERQSRYAPMIHERLRKAGLPDDMIFLPLIESWFDPNAYSRAAAVGMWQFMTRTAKGVGMRVDWWIDDRRDPVRATDGAMIFLKQLNANFGSIYLAAAAYNGGPGRVSRGLEQHATKLAGSVGDEQFFVLAASKALHTETSDYVPKLIAAALVGKDPARYGVEARTVAPFTFDSVLVPAAVPLAAVAKATRVPLDTVKDYNLNILRGMTPPSGGTMWLRVPVGSAAGFTERFDALDKAERTAVKRVVAKEGDFITKIARAHGLTATQLNLYNPGASRLKNGNLRAKQTILVPRADVVKAARGVPNPAIEGYGTSRNAVYVVKRGESLSVIARRNGMTLARLKSLNGLKSDKIRAGQRLRVR